MSTPRRNGGGGGRARGRAAAVDVVTTDLTRDPRWEAPEGQHDARAARARAHTPPLGTDHATLVLLVDDNADNRELFRVCLQDVGFRVVEAHDGQAAIDKALTEPPDVIVMDGAMPVMDGYLATRLLKGDLRTREIPIAIITAGGRECEHDATSAGCDAFLVKPCPPEELGRVVTRLARNRRRGRGGAPGGEGANGDRDLPFYAGRNAVAAGRHGAFAPRLQTTNNKKESPRKR